MSLLINQLSTDQIRTAITLDAIIVPGGEDISRLRSQHAFELLVDSMQKYNIQPLLVATGKSPITYNFEEFSSEAEATLRYIKMWNNVTSKSLSKKLLLSEKKSLDTFGNFYFSKELLDQTLSGYIRKKIGIITNPYHMDRSIWCAKQFFPDCKIEALPTQKQFAYAQKHIKENAGLLAFKLVLGNRDPVEFLETSHPLYAPLETSSPLLIKLFKARIEKNFPKE